ncbi:MAG: choice-of-anchor E domain-containing protein [Gemmataceae bacterium]
MSDVTRPARPRPGLEPLEDRSVPATFNSLAELLRSVPAARPTLAPASHAQAPMYNLGSQGTSQTTTTTTTPVPTSATGQPQTTAQATFGSALVGQARASTLEKFNASLGRLTKVEIIAEGAMSAQAKVENLGPRAGTVKADLQGSLSYRVAGMASPVTASLTKTESGAVTAFDGTADLAGTSARAFGLQTSAAFQTVTLSDAASLALFSGTGTLQVVQDSDADTCVCGPGNLMGAVETVASGTFRVVYHYTPAAELGSIAGYVYHDVNKNGAFTAGDRMLPRVRITLTGTDIYGAAVSRTVVTRANGWFSFTGLTAGTYTITETQPAGYQQGTNAAGSAGGTVTGDTIAAINLQARQNATQYSFGEIRTTPTPPTTPPNPLGRPVVGKWAFGGAFGWL